MAHAVESLARQRSRERPWEKERRYSWRRSPYRWSEILRMRSFEPKLKRRACRERADMGQRFVARDMGRYRITCGPEPLRGSGTGTKFSAQVRFSSLCCPEPCIGIVNSALLYTQLGRLRHPRPHAFRLSSLNLPQSML